MLWLHVTVGDLHFDGRIMAPPLPERLLRILVVSDITKTATQIVAYRRAL